jgi:hypothetical protein
VSADEPQFNCDADGCAQPSVIRITKETWDVTVEEHWCADHNPLAGWVTADG